MKLSKKVGIIVKQDTYKKLEDISIGLCTPMAEIYRLALKGYIDRNKDKTSLDLDAEECTNGVDRPINFFVTPYMYDDLNKLAYRTGLSYKTITSVARQAFSDYIQLHGR